jgi:hypothetical protein
MTTTAPLDVSTTYLARPGAVAQVRYAGSSRWVTERIEGRTFGCATRQGEWIVLHESGGVCAECSVCVPVGQFEECFAEVRS